MIQTHQTVGNLPGWIISTHRRNNVERVLTSSDDSHIFNSAQYDADISITCPLGLGGGTFEMNIPAFTDDDYKFLKTAKTLRLYLFWVDTNSSVSGYLTNLAGISSIISPPSDLTPESTAFVAEIAITEVQRKAGSRNYITKIKGRSSFFETLQKPLGDLLAQSIETLPRIQAITSILENHQIPFELIAQPSPPTPPTDSPPTLPEVDSTQSALAVINNLIGAERHSLNKYGRGLLLSRQGTLIIGPRNILEPARSHQVTPESGLIQITSTGNSPKLLNPPEDDETPPRQRFTLLLKGRSDIKVGDTITFAAPPGENLADTSDNSWGALGNLAEAITSKIPSAPQPDTTAYVEEIEHRLSKQTGYSTTLAVITLTPADGEDGAWDSYHRQQIDPEQASPSENAGPPAPSEALSATNPPISLSRSIDARIQRFIASRPADDMGEIRFSHLEDSDSQPHSSYIWLGADGNVPNQCRIARPSPNRISHVPYLTPYSWGYCGLMIPRFPGEKILVTHRLSQANQPIDVGSVHEHSLGPQGAEEGDWWLSLPLFSTNQEPVEPATDEEPTPYTGKISQDLTTTAGQRYIEVGELTIRVGQDALKSAGPDMRPDESDTAQSITIVHTKNNAKIVIDQEGKVTITANEIEMNSSGDIALNAEGDVNIGASNVNVSVSGKMDIS